MTLVGLDSKTATGVRHDTSDAKSTLPGRIRNPSDVDEAVVDGSKRIDDHASVGVLAVVNHHEGGVNARGAIRLVIDRKLIRVFNEPTAESLHICR